jgi:hypothetical protein
MVSIRGFWYAVHRPQIGMPSSDFSCFSVVYRLNPMSSQCAEIRSHAFARPARRSSFVRLGLGSGADLWKGLDLDRAVWPPEAEAEADVEGFLSLSVPGACPLWRLALALDFDPVVVMGLAFDFAFGLGRKCGLRGPGESRIRSPWNEGSWSMRCETARRPRPYPALAVSERSWGLRTASGGAIGR